MEERRGQLAAGGFGAEDSMKIIKSVMEKTAAKIEMSSNKDQSLTFLISGKTDAVLRARRELLAQFQVLLLLNHRNHLNTGLSGVGDFCLVF